MTPADHAAPVRQRTGADRCPGVLRPWPAADGLLVRLRLVGGRLPKTALARLLAVSAEFADSRVHLTGRANLQVRGLAGHDGRLAPAALAALESTGLVPSRSHELIRNIVVSPQTGYAGGRIDLRPVAADLDARLCAEPRFAQLPGRFLFVLDDGHGDLRDRPADVGLVALSAAEAQLRVGDHWGAVVGVATAADRLIEIAGAFLAARGHGPDAPWHIRELAVPLGPAGAADPRLPTAVARLPYGAVPGGRHVEVPDGVLTPELGRQLLDSVDGGELIVTPWRGILVPCGQDASS